MEEHTREFSSVYFRISKGSSKTTPNKPQDMLFIKKNSSKVSQTPHELRASLSFKENNHKKNKYYLKNRKKNHRNSSIMGGLIEFVETESEQTSRASELLKK